MIAVIDMFLCAFILWQSLNGLNQMHSRTHHGLRIAYILMAAGSFGFLLAIPSGIVRPTFLDATMDLGIAALVWRQEEIMELRHGVD